MADFITSLSNPLIKQARALKQKKARDESGAFLVEGILHVGQALEAGWPVDVLFHSPELLTSEFARQLLAEAAAKHIRCQQVSREVFESLAEKDNPQGLAAILRQKETSLTGLRVRKNSLFAAVVSPQDPGNVGAILRTLDAVGADGLILLEGGADPYHPSAVRASMGTLFFVPFAEASFEAFVQWAGKKGFLLVGTSARGSLDYRQFAPPEKQAVLLLGSEQKGLSDAHMAACQQLIRLPMRGRASSLNLAVAAGVLLYRLSEDRK